MKAATKEKTPMSSSYEEEVAAILRSAPEPVPWFVREYAFARSWGRAWRFDFAWVACLVALEVDGGTHMVSVGPDGRRRVGGRHNSDADREKLNAAAAMGWRVVRWTPAMWSRRQLPTSLYVLRLALLAVPAWHPCEPPLENDTLW
jgi:hypothetical protein